MNADRTLVLGKDIAMLAAFAALTGMLFLALLHAPISPFVVVPVLAYMLPAVPSAAVKLYRDLQGDHLSA